MEDFSNMYYGARMTYAAYNQDPVSMHVSLATNALAAKGASYIEAQQKLASMVRGMQRYYKSTVQIDRTPLQEVWRNGEVSLCCIPAHVYKPENPSLVLVPSMINKSYILDLMGNCSLLRWLAAQGINAYLLDWGNSTDDAGQNTINDVVLARLVPALNFLHEKSGKPVHALGYCMGGTLLIGAAQLLKQKLASLTLLATPWDFHAGSGGLLGAVKFWAPSAAQVLGTQDALPASVMHHLFALLDPEAPLRKFPKFDAMELGSAAERLFIATENWVNDGVDLPRDVAHGCIHDWFLGNAPMQGAWMLSDTLVAPRNVDCPVLVVASRNDRLVEPEMALAVCSDIKHAQVLRPETGHIGVIVGKNAARDVWCPMAKWILKNQ